MSAADLKTKSSAAIQACASDLYDLSQEIWKNPELAFKERYAHRVLTDFLENRGFRVDRHYKLETAFRAVCGEEGGLHVCVICEYDALPGIGHGCGHNLIAEVGVAAGIAIKAAIQDFKQPVKLTVMGTPAEEAGGGKNFLIQDGCFKDVDFAMMAHPFTYNVSRWREILQTCNSTVITPRKSDPRKGWTRELLFNHYFVCLCRHSLEVTYKGKASHPAYQTWEGTNALDAAVLCYSNISVLRQQMKPHHQVHGIIENGGTHPDVIPSETKLTFYLRAHTETELTNLEKRVVGCVESAAMATGCQVEYNFKRDASKYSNLMQNNTLATLYERNAEVLGVTNCSDESVTGAISGSTDMGNVTHVVPGIHPMFALPTDASIHSRHFTEEAGTLEAQPYALNQARALAMTAVDVICQSQLMDTIREEFKQDLAND
ncbi:PM20D2 [Branchiostoma lanceolatum]|uniref:Peptidase M20 domain-containing protein 2 n=1 Tax=Branchiostoma lanceolatum TaxID=7740 RepID=A0A8J9V6A4_BRALA|nr:PM20D2 [Branchiostoma lanceolatum]